MQRALRTTAAICFMNIRLGKLKKLVWCSKIALRTLESARHGSVNCFAKRIKSKLTRNYSKSGGCVVLKGKGTMRRIGTNKTNVVDGNDFN